MSETRKIAAIMVADIVGYGRLAGTDEDRTLARLRALRSDLIDPTIAIYLGRVVKRTGDGALVEFRSVVDAVRCAVEIQHAMFERNAGMAADRRIEFRIGIHLGDVVEEADGDLMGDGVDIAARLEGIAAPGAICLSEQAYWQVKGRLNLVVVDLGPTQLKHIAEPIRVYSLQVDLHPQAKTATELMTPERPLEPKSRSRLMLLGVAIVAVIAIAAGGWRLIVASPPLASAHMSMVVLPFANLSGDPGQDYLADALTDELTTALARLPQTFVIARNTAFTYKGKPADAKTIGKDLDVRYVLEGSLQPSGNQLRVNAQLIDANSGAHLWSEKFDTARTDLLQTQDEIVTRLARALEYQLPVVEAAQLKRTPVTNPDAEDLALRCSGDVFKGVSAGEQSEATWNATWSLCEQALASDPNNVRALTFLAAKFLPRNRGADTRNDLNRADELASKALALDPNYSDAHFVKARVLQSQFRLDEAIAEDQRTLELNPSDVYAYEDIGFAYRRLWR